MTSDFDKLRSSESVLSVIELCRDISNVNTMIINRLDIQDKTNAAMLKFCQSAMDCLDNLEERLKILETLNKSDETFPKLNL